MGHSNRKGPKAASGRATFVEPSDVGSGVFTETAGPPLPREAAFDSDDELLRDLEEEDPTKVVLVGGHTSSDTEVQVPTPPPRAKPPARPRRRPKKQEGFADQPAHVSTPAPVGAGDRISVGKGGHPISKTTVGPTLVPFGRYHLVKRLAFGGMGEIWLAAQRAPGGFSKLVAIKRLLSHYQGDANLTGMFFDEARLQALLSDRHIVQIYDMGEEDDHLYIAMEYVHGVSFKEILDRAKKSDVDVPLAFIADIVIQACRGLSYAHNVTDSRGEPLQIVHRDVNPHNILVSFGGEVKIIDFGIAKSEMSAGRTETGTIKGKFAYMSPEQSAAEALDRRSDIFSLGIVLYELLTGENPFHRQNVVLSLEAIQKYHPPALESLRPEAQILAPIVRRALTKNADDRYMDCSELGEALLVLLEEGRLGDPPSSLSEWLHGLFAHEITQHSALLEETGAGAGIALRAPSGTSPGGGTYSGSRRPSGSGALPSSPSAAKLQSPQGPPPVDGFDVDLFSDVLVEPALQPIVGPPLPASAFGDVLAPEAPGDRLLGDLDAGGDGAAPAMEFRSAARRPDTSPTHPSATALEPKKKRSKLVLFMGASLGAFFTIGAVIGLAFFLQREAPVEDIASAPEALPEAAEPGGDDSKNEAAKNEDAKNEAAKNEAAKSEAAKNEDAKNEDAKNEDAKNEAAKNEAAKNEDAKNEDAKNEDAKNEDAKNRAAKNEAAKKEAKTSAGTSSRRRRARRRGTTATTATDPEKAPTTKKPGPEPKVATAPPPKVATKKVALRASSGRVVGSSKGKLTGSRAKVFVAENEGGLKARVSVTATETGASVSVTATPWALLRQDNASKGKTPVKKLQIAAGRPTRLLLRHPKHGDIAVVVTLYKH